MNPTDHERHSERLGAYIRGTLGPEETEETRAHLTGCPTCRQEEAALNALLSVPLEGLRPGESERLRAAVLAKIGADEKPSPAAVPSQAAVVEPRRSWAPRIAQFMAAAAVIALAAIYLTNPTVSPLGGDDSGPVPAANGRDDSDEGSEKRRAGAPEGGDGDAAVGVTEEAAEDTSGAGGAVADDGDTRTRGGAEVSPTTEVAYGTAEPGEDAAAPDEIAALKAGRFKFGAAAAYRGRR